MVTGYEGTEEQVAARRAAVTAVLADLGGTALGTEPGEKWAARPLRRSLPARRAPRPRRARRDARDRDLLVEPPSGCTPTSRPRSPRRSATGSLVLCHVSHVYETGCSLYFTVAARQGDDPIAAVAGGQGRGQRRDHRGGRDDHPPPRDRHRPQAVVRPGDRGRRGAGAPRGQGRARPGRGSSTRACSSPSPSRHARSSVIRTSTVWVRIGMTLAAPAGQAKDHTRSSVGSVAVTT